MVEASQTTFDKLSSVKALKDYYENEVTKTHLKDLLNNEDRNSKLRASLDNKIILDLTHTKIDIKGIELLQKVVDETKIFDKVQAMFNGDVINTTEKR